MITIGDIRPGRSSNLTPPAGFVGALKGNTGGRADKLPLDVPKGSHVIPADVVAALGGGNSQNGHRILFGMFPFSRPMKKGKSIVPRLSRSRSKRANGGAVPIMASDGEFVIAPEDVLRTGGGDNEKGHQRLDDFILHIRKMNIEHLKSLPEPAK